MVAEKQNADYQLSIANDWIQSKISNEVEIKVKINRMNKFKDVIQVEVDELPEGVECEKVESKKRRRFIQIGHPQTERDPNLSRPVRIVGRMSIRQKCSHRDRRELKTHWLSIDPK